MTQLAPTTIVQSQAVALIRSLLTKYNATEIKDNAAVKTQLRDILTQFLNKVGRPLADFEPFVPGEPILSEKMARLIHGMESDINILLEQSEFSQAATVFLFNYITTEVEKAKRENSQTANKFKTLQLYSSARDENVIVFGDYFKTDEMIDWSQVPSAERASIQFPGHVTLPRVPSNAQKLLEKATVTVLDSSNGFLGNNQELDPVSFSNPALIAEGQDSQTDYVFYAEGNRRAEFKALLDQDPTSWIEYESYLVSAADRQSAKNYGFYYSKTNPTTGQKELVDWANGPLDVDNKRKELIQAAGPGVKDFDQLLEMSKKFGNSVDAAIKKFLLENEFNTLKFDFQVDLKTVTKINTITLRPYGLVDNKNYPIKVEVVETSENGNDWVAVLPQDVWIANEINAQAARAADSATISSGVWIFPERSAQYIRFRLRQPRPVDAKIGHIYWETKKKTVREIKQIILNPNSATPTMTSEVTEKIVGGDRQEGPIPTVANPIAYHKDSMVQSGDLVKKVEHFSGKRWAIGIRDISIEQSIYGQKASLVSKPYKINGIVDRVALEADIQVPSTFTYEEGKLWVKFFVSPNDGISWYPISRIQDDFLLLPEIIAFNDPLPEEFREAGVKYYNVSGAVNSLRVKIEISRPGSAVNASNPTAASTQNDIYASSTPILHSYKLKVRKR